MSQPKACHTNVTQPCLSLRGWNTVQHHVAAAQAAFFEAKTAPTQWHRDRAMGKVFGEVGAAKDRLVTLTKVEPGIRRRCRAKLLEIDAFTSQVRAWAAAIVRQPAKVIDFPVRHRPATKRSRRRAEDRPRVNENLRLVTDEAPAAC